MIRSVLILMMLFLSCNSVLAEQFYKKELKDRYWDVYGFSESTTGQVDCYALSANKDGSAIEIHRALNTGEFWIFIRNMNWEVNSERIGKDSEARVNLYDRNYRVTGGGNLSFHMKNKNTVLFLNIESKSFINNMWNSTHIRFIMPDGMNNVSYEFENAKEVVSALSDCVAKNEAKYKNFKGSGTSTDNPATIKGRI